MLLKIIIGLFGLGIVVFVHELGHFLVAKAVGIDVLTFSIGWGKKLFGFTRNGTEYRVSVFPVGGFCKMKGEEVLKKAVENNEPVSDTEPGSYFSASPAKRIAVSVAGPLFNLLFAVIVVTIIWLVGFTYPSYGNRVVLASEYPVPGQPVTSFPADAAGIRTGDRITSINGKEIRSFRDIQESIVVAPGERLEVSVARGNEERTLSVTPQLDKETASGLIGIHVWIEPVLESVTPGSPAAWAGLLPGDRIVAVDGKPVTHALDLTYRFIEMPTAVTITYERNGTRLEGVLKPVYDGSESQDQGLVFRHEDFHSPGMNVFQAAAKGLSETWKTLTLTVKGIGLLFSGVNVSDAVTGPIRMTYYVGEVASQGFSQGIGAGVSSVFNFLSLISIGLAFMNLLPFPIFDGGMIVLFLVEMFRRKPIGPKAFYRFQMVGVVIIFSLIILAVMGDVSFLLRQ